MKNSPKFFSNFVAMKILFLEKIDPYVIKLAKASFTNTENILWGIRYIYIYTGCNETLFQGSRVWFRT